MYRYVGVVHVVSPTLAFGAKGFKKRTIVLEDNSGRYTEYIPFSLTGDSCSFADDLRVGDTVEVHFFLKGRKWQKDKESETKYFLDAEITKLAQMKQYSNEKTDSYQHASRPSVVRPAETQGAELDGTPF